MVLGPPSHPPWSTGTAIRGRPWGRRGAPGHMQWLGWGRSVPTPQRGRILPQEELCWESWGGGDAPQGVGGGCSQAPNKSALFLQAAGVAGGPAWCPCRWPPSLRSLFCGGLGGLLAHPPQLCGAFHWGVPPAQGCPCPRPLLSWGGGWGICECAQACKARAEASLGARARAKPLHLYPWCTRVCKAPAAGHLVHVHMQSRCIWPSCARACVSSPPPPALPVPYPSPSVGSGVPPSRSPPVPATAHRDRPGAGTVAPTRSSSRSPGPRPSGWRRWS